jgi:hypothetical protein
MVGDACEDVGKPSLWIDVVHLGRLCRGPNYAEWSGVVAAAQADLQGVERALSQFHSA